MTIFGSLRHAKITCVRESRGVSGCTGVRGVPRLNINMKMRRGGYHRGKGWKKRIQSANIGVGGGKSRAMRPLGMGKSMGLCLIPRNSIFCVINVPMGLLLTTQNGN